MFHTTSRAVTWAHPRWLCGVPTILVRKWWRIWPSFPELPSRWPANQDCDIIYKDDLALKLKSIVEHFRRSFIIHLALTNIWISSDIISLCWSQRTFENRTKIRRQCPFLVVFTIVMDILHYFTVPSLHWIVCTL